MNNTNLWLWQYYNKLSCKTSNINRTLVGNKIVDNSDVVGASPVGAAPTTSSFSTYHLASMDFSEDNCNRMQETFKLWDLVRLILELLRQVSWVSNTHSWCLCYDMVSTLQNIHSRPQKLACEGSWDIGHFFQVQGLIYVLSLSRHTVYNVIACYFGPGCEETHCTMSSETLLLRSFPSELTFIENFVLLSSKF